MNEIRLSDRAAALAACVYYREIRENAEIIVKNKHFTIMNPVGDIT